ncbi:glycosyltransferase family 4 protein [Campylobacter sp. RM9344]|uniref:Glycosyltransferase family 4 protein n=1 Tax=Campylobacter californiensis TaxID=1032243 RepID=A0AAW3ZRI2_9BACT|nr:MULTISPECIES: glycosyltransferase family 4 protein [unclassified Campylobacter]MBE2983875.1 glycosyltransferase family 4 protein [Campylobacter sp. RM6883]MBE2994413.1 glycosyltransferase family 4 protein [Campylobacter sp. RM6913]MBE3028721.1 glycosyltransferase family 4 protein [Campylobacter sp. RM9344]MBE3607610.1 glycosyltransferase family 4 protein [Campylobacter sp. RM9337]QCD51001.1 glycosyltransferase, family 1 [Campylobacter sp. RM6914]
MKILFITDNFPPEVNAPATRTYEHVKEWIKDKDVEVTILTCAPNFPHGKVYDGYKNRFYQREKFDGIDVIRVWSYMSKNEGFIKRVLDYTSFAFMAFWIGLFEKFDVIVATSPQFFTTWAGWGLAKIKRKPWVFELRDLWPESIKTVGAMKHGKAIEILEKIELGLYKSSDLVVAVTQAFKQNLINRGIDESKIKVVTNGSNLDLFVPREKDKALLSELKLKDKFVVGYIGTHGMAHSLDFIVRSISKIKDERFHFLFVGDGAVKSSVVGLADSLGLRNVTFLEPVLKDEVPRYLSICDVMLAPLKKDDNFKIVIPSKIFEASAMQKPILLGVEGQAKEILEKYGAGVCFEPENEADFIKKLNTLKDATIYNECKNSCLKLANDYNRKKLANDMIGILKTLA